MRWKAIKRIPFRGVPEGEETLVYVDAFVPEEGLLLVDIYTTERQRPAVRRAYTETDYGVWFTENDTTAGRGIDNFPFDNLDLGNFTTTDHGTAVLSDESLAVIRSFTGYRYSPYSWDSMLQTHERRVRRDRETRRHKKKLDACRERDSNMPEIPEEFREWVRSYLLPEEYLYYRRNGSYADYFCSACGGEATKRIRRSERYPDCMVDGAIEPPKNGKAMRCPLCGKWAVLKPAGRVKGVYGLSKPCYLIQKYGSGIVARYFEAEKYFRVDEAAEISETEIARGFLLPGQKLQIDYHKYSHFSGETFWDYVNLEGMANIVDKPGDVWPGSYRELEGTKWQYTGIREYTGSRRFVKAIRYMEAYRQSPGLEMISKAGMTDLADDVICGNVKIGWGKPWQALGIRKDRMDMLIRHRGNSASRSVLKLEQDMGQRWNEAETEYLIALNPNTADTEHLLRYMTLRQLVRYVSVQSGTDPEAVGNCAGATERAVNTLRTYADYIRMREAAGYDLSNTVFLFPRHLRTAHDAMVLETEKTKMDKRKEEVREKFPGIRKSYRALRNRYLCEAEGFLIRPARSAEEIVEEGRILHHCVGGDTYLERHSEGRSIILMLRHAEEPEMPFVTVEILPDGHIAQWYGMYDRKPEKEKIDPWLAAYVRNLQGTQEEAERPRVMVGA